MRFFQRITDWWHSIHRDWRYDNEPVDLGTLFDSDMLASPVQPLSEIDGHWTVGRAAEKAARRAARGAPPHKIRMSAPEPGAAIIHVNPPWLNEDPPWMQGNH